MRLPLKFIAILWVTLSAEGRISFANGIEEISHHLTNFHSRNIQSDLPCVLFMNFQEKSGLKRKKWTMDMSWQLISRTHLKSGALKIQPQVVHNIHSAVQNYV